MAEDKRHRKEMHTEDAPPEEVSDDTEAQERSLDDANDRLQDTGGASQETEGRTGQSSIERESGTPSENSGAQSGPSQEVEAPEVNVAPPETRRPQHSNEGQPQPTGDAPSSDSNGASPVDESADSPDSEQPQQEPQASDAAETPQHSAGRPAEPQHTERPSGNTEPPDGHSETPEDEAPSSADEDIDDGDLDDAPESLEDDDAPADVHEDAPAEAKEAEPSTDDEQPPEETPDTEDAADTPETDAEDSEDASDAEAAPDDATQADADDEDVDAPEDEDPDNPDAPEDEDPDAPEGVDSDNPDAPEGVDADNPDAPADGDSDGADAGSAQSETSSSSASEEDEGSEAEPEDSEDASSDSSPEQPDEAVPDTPDDASGDAPDAQAGGSAPGDSGVGGIAGKAGQAVNAARTLGSAVQAAKSGSAKELTKASAQMAGRAAAAGITKFVLATTAPILIPVLLGILALVFFLILVMSLFTSQDEMYTGSIEVQTCDVPPFFASGTTEEEVAAAIHGIIEGELGEGEVSDVAIAAFLGNVMQESTMNPQKIQSDVSWNAAAAKDPTYNGYAIGLLQYDGSRRVELLEHVGYEMDQWSNIHAQLDFMLNHDGEAERQMMRDWLTDTSLTYADLNRVTEEMVVNWWRAGMPMLQNRLDYADYWYGLMGKDEHSNLRDANLGALLSRQSADCNYGLFGDMLDSVPANGKDGSWVVWGLSFEELKNDYPEYFEYLAIGPFTLEDERKYLDDGHGYKPHLRGQCTELTFGYMRKLWSAELPPTSASGPGLSEGHLIGNGGYLYKAYEQKGAHLTFDPTVGYGFSSTATPTNHYGHTGMVVGVMPDGSFIIADYNSKANAHNDLIRDLRYHVVDGNRSGPISSYTGHIRPPGSTAPYYIFYSGIGEPVGGHINTDKNKDENDGDDGDKDGDDDGDGGCLFLC